MLVMGVDIGSAACKCVILKDGKEVIAKSVIPLGTGTVGPKRAVDEALAESGLTKDDISRVLVTGYGRFVFDGADSQKSEISCHARGVAFLLPSTRTIIDIGGQDIKVIKINEKGHFDSFAMNDKCAAGTGKFMEAMAAILNVKVWELGEISKASTAEVSVSNTCTVFAESEVVSILSSNEKLEDIVAGIHRSVAKRVAALAHRNGIIKDVAISGGVALNEGVVKTLSEELKTEVLATPDCQIAGALGAALLAWEELMQQQ